MTYIRLFSKNRPIVVSSLPVFHLKRIRVKEITALEPYRERVRHKMDALFNRIDTGRVYLLSPNKFQM